MNVADITPPRTATPATTVSIASTPVTPIQAANAHFTITLYGNDTPSRLPIIIGVYQEEEDNYAWTIQPRSILGQLLEVLVDN